jgi:hypothetical protein
MLEPMTKEIGGVNFQFLPMPVLRASRLDKKVLGLLAPIIGGLESLDPTAEVSMESLTGGLSRAMDSLDDNTLTTLIKDTLTFVTWIGEKGAQPLSSEAMLDSCFQGRLDLMYKVMFEAWRYNKFTPFSVLEHFGGLGQILTSAKGSIGDKKSGLKLERSAN